MLTKPKSLNIFFRLINVPYGELYYKLDQQFKQPRAIINIHIVVPAILESLENHVCMDILISYLSQQLEKDTYAATLAYFHHSIKVTEKGFNITLSGFNDKLLLLLNVILDHFKDFEKNLEKQFSVFHLPRGASDNKINISTPSITYLIKKKPLIL